MTVRLAEERDVHDVAELDKLCFAMPWSEESFRQEFTENERALYIVAEIGGRIVGYAGMWVILDEGHITNVCVHPDYRKRHIGEGILRVLIAAGAQVGVERTTLEVRKSNAPAIALYEKLGFVSEGVRKGYYENNNEDAIIMWRG